MNTRPKPLPRRFTPLEILNRATEYEIHVTLDGENLMVDVPATLEEEKKDKALAVITANKPEIVKYLQDLFGSTPLCYTCLDEDKETPALPDDFEGIMYCADHHPNHKPIASRDMERRTTEWQLQQQ